MTAHWFGPRSGSSKGEGHPVMFGDPQPAVHFDAMPDGGGYPKGFVEWAAREMECSPTEILHVCSGSVRTGLTVDVRERMQPAVVADGTRLPFRDGSFRYVLADPPYSEDYAANLYDTASAYPSPSVLTNEVSRVLTPGGLFGLMHFQVPMVRKPMKIRKVYGITTGAGYAIRAWTLMVKRFDTAEMAL
jgi:hypothetical protein